MRNLLLVRYGEIFLKGQNRPLFMRALVKRIKYAVKDLGATVLLHDGRILVSDFDDLDECIRRVTKVFGVHSVCPAVEMPKDDFDALCNQAVAMMADLSGTFRVTARRSDKNYFMDSPAINIEMGHRILTANKNLSVDVKKPQHTMNVEIRDMAYLYVKVIPAVGGMPVGTNGRATLLLSGGIDSPVAGWMIAKRGVHIHTRLTARRKRCWIWRAFCPKAAAASASTSCRSPKSRWKSTKSAPKSTRRSSCAAL